ncbi:cytochrome P450 oxidoreductase [Mycena metata]|uniref:Cytochrome P450 oxidoreductase n=1 Tax=Mycena metata TaxID=1033252 RepID=A0AAD7K856_9AGAR|nr:cytochrome P450 oxidoreductase [Mycena metata]
MFPLLNFLPLLGFASLAIILYALYNLLLHPLCGLPGPIGAKTGLWSWKSTRAVKLDMGWKLLKLHRRYGTIVRIARNEASICDPGAISQIYSFKSPLQKTRFYESLSGLDGPTSISTVDNKHHGEMRRAESPAYSAKLFPNFEQNIDTCTNDLFNYLDRCIADGKGTVDLALILQFFVIDVVGELALSKSFELSATGRDTCQFLPLLVKFLEMACLVGTQPMVAPILRRISKMGLVSSRIESRSKEYKNQEIYSNHHNMLQVFDSDSEMINILTCCSAQLLTAQNPDGSEYSLEQVRAAVDLLTCSVDTTAITMRAMIRFVVGEAEIYTKVQIEIDDAVNCGAITFPLSYDDARKLPYLQACLKETLRLHPPVPWTLSRSVGRGGAIIAGHFFVEGTEVSMSPFVVHRRQEACGDDAEAFRPERWIEADTDQRKTMEHNNLAFGSGPRVCAGKAIGMMEVSKFMPFLLWKYRISFTPRSETSPHLRKVGRGVDGRVSAAEPYFVTSQWVVLQSDFWCDLSRRK